MSHRWNHGMCSLSRLNSFIYLVIRIYVWVFPTFLWTDSYFINFGVKTSRSSPCHCLTRPPSGSCCCLCPQPPVVLSWPPLSFLSLLLSLSVSLFFPILSVSHCSFCLCPVSLTGPICLISVSKQTRPEPEIVEWTVPQG